MNRTISHEEHYLQVQFYQKFIKNKEQEIQELKTKLQNEQNLNEVLKAKLEVSQKNNITL